MDQVTIEPNGQWSQTSDHAPSPTGSRNDHSYSDDQEDIIEIQGAPRLASVKSEATREPSLTRTPPIYSRDPDYSPAAPQASTSSNKRSAAQVVDLTLSSDEEDEPPRATKHHKASSDLLGPSNKDSTPLRTNGTNSGLPRQPTSNPFTVPNYGRKEYALPPPRI